MSGNPGDAPIDGIEDTIEANQQMDQEQQAQMQQMVWGMLEQRVVQFLNTIEADIETRRATEWLDNGEAIDQFTAVEEGGDPQAASADALLELQKAFMRVVASFVEVQNNPQMGTDPLKDAVTELVVTLHDPGLREALLLVVKPDYRDDVRERLGEFSKALWGLRQMMVGEDGDEFWFLLSTLANMQNQTIEELIQPVEGVSPADIPAEYRG